MRELRAFELALASLTRLPSSPTAHASDAAMSRRATVYFPLVGALIGAITLGLVRCGEEIWSTWLAVIVALAFEARLTGAVHEIAWANAWDAFGGGWTRERTLELLKDSRVGVYGALALIFGVLLRFGGLTVMPDERLAPALIASAALGRWSGLWVQAWAPPPAEREGSTRAMADVGAQEVLLSAAFVLPAVVWLARIAPTTAAASLLLVALVVAGARSLFLPRIGGTTGDCAGATNYATQIVVLLACAATRS